MKKLIFTLIALVAVQLGFSQTTYYWVGGAGPASFTGSSNWNTQLDGSGSSRSTSQATDILIFDGTNIGGSTPTTGAIIATVTATSMGRLILQNGADVALTRTSSGTSTVTIGDDPSGHDFVVFSGCIFRLKGTTGNVAIVLANDAANNNTPPATTSATAMIYGDIIIEEATSGNTAQNRFISRMKGAFVFASGSSIKVLAASQYYPFGSTGSSTTPAAEGVIFESGSSYYYEGGLSPFGSNSTSFLVKFNPGSKFYFRATPAANMFGGRSYADVIVENNATVTSNGSLQRIDNLQIESGATFITNTSGVTPIHGNIIVNGTFKVPDTDPNRGNKIVIAGSGTQTLSGTGTVILADLITSDASTLTLQKNITIDSINKVIGRLNATGYTISGSATTSSKAPASVNITGNLNVDSFLVKNISDLTGVEIGMSVSGSGIPANTVVVNLSSTNNTITLSKAVTGAVTYAGASQALTVFNGQGVLPVRFISFTAGLDRSSAVQLKWEIAGEEKITNYLVERSLNAREFTSIGKVNASNQKTYSYTDNTPVSGPAYYRIKAIDADGKVIYTNAVKVSSGKLAQLEIYPNPVKGNTINLSFTPATEGLYTLTLVNSAGQQIMNRSLGQLQNNFNSSIVLPSNVQPGLYTLIIRSAEAQLKQTVLIQ